MSTYLLLSLFLLLTPTALSTTTTCKSTTFTTPNKTFTSCTDLPHLSATLHWTLSSSSLSIAFSAPSPGWIAWAINPTALAMAGSQALLAYKSPNGSLSVHTYNIQSYSFPDSPTNISYKVSALSAESSNNKLTVFGTWELPRNTHFINQVWQVGPSVTKGVPAKHAFAQDNLNSMSKLSLSAAAVPKTVSPAEAPASATAGPVVAGGGAAAAPVAGKNGAGEVSVGVFGVLVGAVLGFLI